MTSVMSSALASATVHLVLLNRKTPASSKTSIIQSPLKVGWVDEIVSPEIKVNDDDASKL